MNLLRTLCITLSLVIGAAAVTYSSPYFSKGTQVISIVNRNNQPTTVIVANNLTTQQRELLAFAYQVAKDDGMSNPNYLQGILLQESNGCHGKNWRVAGLTNRVGDRYFGCGQIKVVAAREVLKKYPKMRKYLNTDTDEEIQARLILDDKFNIRIASKFLLMMGVNENPAKAITAYNVGPGAARHVNPRTHYYTQRVELFSKKMRNVQVSTSEIKLSSKDKIILASDP